jgi:hypothetical protein
MSQRARRERGGERENFQSAARIGKQFIFDEHVEGAVEVRKRDRE